MMSIILDLAVGRSDGAARHVARTREPQETQLVPRRQPDQTVRRHPQEEPVSKAARIALGAMLIVIGMVFTLQGLGYLAGSPMTGVTGWAVIGPVVALVGLVLIVRSVQTRRPR